MVWYLLKLSTRAPWLISLTLSGPIFDTLITPNPAIFRLPPLSRKICLAPYQDSNSKVRHNRERKQQFVCQCQECNKRTACMARAASFPHLTLALGRSGWWGPVCTDGDRSCPYTYTRWRQQQETLLASILHIVIFFFFFWKCQLV